jgi:hypothetical protein
MDLLFHDALKQRPRYRKTVLEYPSIFSTAIAECLETVDGD